MSPAGSGRGQFRGVFAARVDRRNACAWTLPWLLPAGLLGTIALISLSGAIAYLLAGIWGWIVFPYVAVYLRAHSWADGGANNGNSFTDCGADYWRTKLM